MNPLDPTPEEIRAWGKGAVDLMAEYLGSLRDRRVYPATSSRALRDKLNERLPQEGEPFEQLLEKFQETILEGTRQSGHPRMFGYVQSPGTAVAALADLLASTLNSNLTAWRSAPSPVEVERLTIRWLIEILGLKPGAGGLLVSGGSAANLAALAVARRKKGPAEFAAKGAQSLTRPMRLYASVETHHSVAKAATMLGLGHENVCLLPVDENCKIQLAALTRQIERDLEEGLLPFCLVGNAGTVGTGAFDPLGDLAAIAQRFNLWFHVDACYGGFAVLAKSARHLFAAIDQADSVALDPHKWLYLPIDCGCLLYRDPASARLTFAHDAEYTRVLNQEADEAFAFWDYGPELSRRFRALKIWMTLKAVGRRALAEAVEKDLSCARYLEEMVRGSDDFEMLAPVELSIFCFRFVPKEFKQALGAAGQTERAQLESKLDALNERLVIELQRDGSSYLSNAVVHGRFALRGCVINYRTNKRDMEILLEDLRRIAATKLGPISIS